MTYGKTIMGFNGSYQENDNDFSFELDMDIIQMLDGTIVYDMPRFFHVLYETVNRNKTRYTLYQLLYDLNVDKDALDQAFNNTDCVDHQILLNNLTGTSSSVNATLVQQNNSSNVTVNRVVPYVFYCFYNKQQYDKEQHEQKTLRTKHPLLLGIYPDWRKMVRDFISFHNQIIGHLLSPKVLFRNVGTDIFFHKITIRTRFSLNGCLQPCF